MFSLEKSIADWREQMLAAGIKTPVPLEELEIHFREEIERQIKSDLSLNEQEAFNSAVQKIGQGKVLKNEFKKIGGIFENGVMKKFKPVIFVAGTHFSIWWVLCGILSLPHFGKQLFWDEFSTYSGHQGMLHHPFLIDLSECFFVPFYILSLPTMWLWNWFGMWLWRFEFYRSIVWLGWLFFPLLNSLIWGGVVGGLWMAARRKFNRRAVSND
jgi:hypothetical protein